MKENEYIISLWYAEFFSMKTMVVIPGWHACVRQKASTQEVNGRPRPAISVLAIASKSLQTTALGLSTKQSLIKHRYTLRGRVGSNFEVKSALIYRVKGVYMELFQGGRYGQWVSEGEKVEYDNWWVIGHCYLVDCLKLCNKLLLCLPLG